MSANDPKRTCERQGTGCGGELGLLAHGDPATWQRGWRIKRPPLDIFPQSSAKTAFDNLRYPPPSLRARALPIDMDFIVCGEITHVSALFFDALKSAHSMDGDPFAFKGGL
jgi:hypothetical protein